MSSRTSSLKPSLARYAKICGVLPKCLHKPTQEWLESIGDTGDEPLKVWEEPLFQNFSIELAYLPITTPAAAARPHARNWNNIQEGVYVVVTTDRFGVTVTMSNNGAPAPRPGATQAITNLQREDLVAAQIAITDIVLAIRRRQIAKTQTDWPNRALPANFFGGFTYRDLEEIVNTVKYPFVDL